MGELKPSEIEQIKLAANFLNAAASGVLLAAAVIPFIGLALGTPYAAANILTVASLSVVGLALAFVLHFLARWILAGLDR
jgi:hypothetical protein